MAATSRGELNFDGGDMELRVRTGEAAVVVGDVLTIHQVVGGVAGMTEPELVSPIDGYSLASGPILVALSAGVAGSYVTVRQRGRCWAKMAGAPAEPFGPIFIRAAGNSFRLFWSSSVDVPLRSYGFQLRRLATNGQLAEVCLHGVW